MRRMLSAAAVLAGALLAPSPAGAAIPQVFTKTATPVDCVVQPSGQRSSREDDRVHAVDHDAVRRTCRAARATRPSMVSS